MDFVVLTPPAALPVSIDDASAHLRVDFDEDDASVNALLAAAASFVETYTGRALLTRTYRGFLDCWPGDIHRGDQVSSNRRCAVDLPMPPLIAISHVITYDDSDTPTTMDPADYYVDAAGFVGRLLHRADVTWPIPTRVANGIEIQWTAGYGDDPVDVPAHYKHAMLLLIGHWYANREAVVGVDNRDSSAPLPLGVAELLAPHRVYSFA